MSDIIKTATFGSGSNYSDGLQGKWSAQMNMGGLTKLNEQRFFVDGSKTHEEVAEWAYSKLDTQHPWFEWLICQSVSVNPFGGLDKNIVVDMVWDGIPTNSEIARYSCTASLSQEAIDTHPHFENFAGKPSDMDDALGHVPDKGTIFSTNDDETGAFLKFKTLPEADGTEENSKAGVSSYLLPAIIWKESRQLGDGFSSSETADIVEDLGKRYTKVPRKLQDADGSQQTLRDIASEFSGERDWLLISANYTPVGEGGTIDREWRMSGRYGWNKLIYEKGSDSVGQVVRNNNDFSNGEDPYDDGRKITLVGSSGFGASEFYEELSNAWSYNFDKSQKVTAKCTFKAKQGTGLQVAKDFMIGAYRHPKYSYLTAISASINGGEGLDTVSIDFAGVEDDGEWEGQMSVSTMTEPIDTHPNFTSGGGTDADTIGGTPDDPKNGAMFAENGAFEKFANFVPKADIEDLEVPFDEGVGDDSNVPNPMARVSGYLEVGVEWQETKYFKDVEDGLQELENAGKIMKPQSKAPYPPRITGADGEVRDWLNMGGSWEMVANDIGSGCKVTVSYRLSGQRQWDDEIYEKG